MGFSGLERVLMGYTRLEWVKMGSNQVVLGFTKFYWARMGFSGLERVLMGYTRLERVEMDENRLSWVKMGWNRFESSFFVSDSEERHQRLFSLGDFFVLYTFFCHSIRYLAAHRSSLFSLSLSLSLFLFFFFFLFLSLSFYFSSSVSFSGLGWGGGASGYLSASFAGGGRRDVATRRPSSFWGPTPATLTIDSFSLSLSLSLSFFIFSLSLCGSASYGRHPAAKSFWPMEALLIKVWFADLPFYWLFVCFFVFLFHLIFILLLGFVLGSRLDNERMA